MELFDDFVDRFDAPHVLWQRQAPVAQQMGQVPITRVNGWLDLPDAVSQKPQSPLGDNFWIQPPQRAARQIPRISIWLFALRLDLLVHALKVFILHVYFAADLQNRRRLILSFVM